MSALKQQSRQSLTPLQKQLWAELTEVMNIDNRRLSARIKGIGNIKKEESQQAVAAEFKQKLN